MFSSLLLCGIVSSGGNLGLSASAESVHYKRPSTRRSKHLNRSSSRRNKENGSRTGSFRNKNIQNEQQSAASQDQQLSKRNARVSFESSSGSVAQSAGTPKSVAAYSYEHHHSKSIDQVVSSERRHSQQYDFTNRLSVDNDLLVASSNWASLISGGGTAAASSQDSLNSSTATITGTTTTHSKPPRI